MPQLRSERETPPDAWQGDLLRGERAQAMGRPPGKLKPGPGNPRSVVANHQQRRILDSLLEIVGEHGYASVTIRKLAGSAGVSTRSFYQHYPSKEACFLGVHQLVARRVLRSIETASLGAPSDDQRLRLVIAAIVREWASDPRAAHLMLIDAYAAGLPALKQARLVGRSIEARIGECLDYAPDDANLAPLAAEAIVAGIFTAARRCLLRDEGDLADLGDALGPWATAYHGLPARQIEEARLADQAWASNDDATSSSGSEEEGRGAPDGDRALLLAATARLVASRGNADLELEDIVSTAGISRRGFEAEFSDPEACVAAAHRLYADGAIDRVTRAGEKLAPLGDARLALASLGVQIAADPALAALCFSDVAIAGPRLVRSHQRFLTHIACLAAGTTESTRSSVGPAAAASAGALWGPLRQCVIMGRSAQALEIAPTVTSLALFPLKAEASRFFRFVV